MKNGNDVQVYFIAGKKIDLSRSTVLYETRFADLDGWQVVGDARWRAEDNGLVGSLADGGVHGQIFLAKECDGDIIMQFDAATVLPSNHDIIWWWHTELEGGTCGKGYLGALAGWYSGKAGIEKTPEGRLYGGTPLFTFEPGRKYHVVSGSIGGLSFIAVDGRLIFELADPDPFPAGHRGHVGFGVYQSAVRYENLKVYAPHWEKHSESY